MSQEPLVELTRTLCDALRDVTIQTPRVGYVTNYLDYAREPLETYLTRYGSAPNWKTLWLGMNPGPWGTAQTGVPFGDVALTRDWLRITGQVTQPANASPQRPVQGFDCTRSEVSGQRLWGMIRQQFGTPEAFFADHFIWSYCPLMFVHTNGTRNITPDQLLRADQQRIFPPCDDALLAMLTLKQPGHIIGIGRFATLRAQHVLTRYPAELPKPTIVQILHPSPASPAANRGWADQVTEQLKGILPSHPSPPADHLPA